MDSFVNFLANREYSFIWRSYALTGNIIDKFGDAISEKNVKKLINNFFKNCAENLKLVNGSKDSILKLAGFYNILILSNIPFQYYDLRLKALINNKLDFPFYANAGKKGKVCSYLYNKFKLPVWFIDDSPMQIDSASKEKCNINTILYIENKKLAKLVEYPKCWDYYTNTWKKNEKILLNIKR